MATGALGGHTIQTVTINRAYTLPFGLIGCSVTLHDPNRSDGQPTARIAASASSPTTPNNPANILVMDLHANDSDAAGWLVEGNGRELRNVSVSGNATGISVVGRPQHAAQRRGVGNQGIGISVLGQQQLLDTPNVTKSASHGIQVTGDRNQVLKALAGDKDKGNQGDGIRVGGVGNLLQDNRANANGGNGFDVTRRHQRCPEPPQEQPVQFGGQRDGERRRRVRAAELREERRRRQQGRRDRRAEDLGAREVPDVPGGNATVNFPSASVCE